MSLVKVTSEQLISLSGQLTQGASQVDQQLSTMRAQVSPLVGGDWQGSASTAFTTLWDEWARSAASLKEALDGISRLLAQAGQTYQTAEEAIRSSMGR